MNLKFWERRKDTTDEILIQRGAGDENCTTERPVVDTEAPIGGLSFSKIFGANLSPMSLAPVYAAVTLISNLIASVPIVISKVQGDTKTTDKEHYLNGVFKTSLMSIYMIIKKIVVDMYIKGNGFIYIDRANGSKVRSLRYLKPEDVTIVYDDKKNSLFYKATKVKNGLIEPINMLHFYRDTEDGITGVGFMHYARNAFDLANATNSQASSFFESGCSISGVLSTTSNLSDKQRNEIRTNWAQTHGRGKSGIAVLPGGMKYEQIGSTAQSSQLLETRTFNIQEISRFFNIHPVFLSDVTKSNYATIEQAQIELVSHTLLPIIRLMEAELNRKLVLPNEQIVIDLDESYLIRGDRQSTANYLSTLTSNGIISINEARQKLGYGRIDGGDEHIIPFTDIAQNTLENKGKQGETQDKNTETQNENE